MGILANNDRNSLGVTQCFGATIVTDAGYAAARVQTWNRTGAKRNLTAGEGITSNLVGVPDGHRHPSSWVMPQTAGALASRNIIDGAGTFAADGTMGVNGEATLAGVGTLTGTGALIVSLVAALSGSGTISSATALAYLNLAATLAGTGDLAGAGTAIGHAAAALSGSGEAVGLATALGELAASLTVTGATLTTANVASAVWSALAAANNDAGTMGEKLNDAGAGGDPWTVVLEGSYTAADLMRIMSAALAGELSGAGSSTITIRDVNDTEDRIVATVDGTGNRTAVTLTP